MKIEIENCVYKIHSIYDLYTANEDGNIISIISKKNISCKQKNGYKICSVKEYGERSRKTYQVHRFVWECYNGPIPDNKVIDHINNIRDDNRLCNLQLVTTSENNKKAAKNRDYTFATKNHQNKKYVKAINVNTNEVSYYNSLYSVQQHININAGIVKMVCENINRCKTGISKKDGNLYKFEYAKKEDMPDDYKKSANIRPKRVSDEDKKKNKK